MSAIQSNGIVFEVKFCRFVKMVFLSRDELAVSSGANLRSLGRVVTVFVSGYWVMSVVGEEVEIFLAFTARRGRERWDDRWRGSGVSRGVLFLE